MRKIGLALLVLVLAGCATPKVKPVPSVPLSPIAGDYIPLQGGVAMIFKGDGAAVALGDGVAVTCARNANRIDPKSIIGKSADYDLVYLASGKQILNLPVAEPRKGVRVTTYGQGKGGALAMAEGEITAQGVPPTALCAKCEASSAFAFEGSGGPGFIGAPVLDAKTGRLAGIVFGYADGVGGKGVLYAYTMKRVLAEREAVIRKLPEDRD